MGQVKGEPGRYGRRVRVVARVWSVASLSFLSLILVGELLLPSSAEAPTPSEWAGLMLFPGGASLGLILGWRREGWGGTLTVGSLVAFYGWNRAVRGRFPGGPYFALAAAPGFLFLLAWLLARRH